MVSILEVSGGGAGLECGNPSRLGELSVQAKRAKVRMATL